MMPLKLNVLLMCKIGIVIKLQESSYIRLKLDTLKFVFTDSLTIRHTKNKSEGGIGIFGFELKKFIEKSFENMVGTEMSSWVTDGRE